MKKIDGVFYEEVDPNKVKSRIKEYLRHIGLKKLEIKRLNEEILSLEKAIDNTKQSLPEIVNEVELEESRRKYIEKEGGVIDVKDESKED